MMKGSKQEPKCKFSRATLKMLEGYDFDTYNILDDYPLREINKTVQNWNT